MARTVVGEGGRITIPRAIRTAVGVRDGDALDIEVTEDGILLTLADAHERSEADHHRVDQALAAIAAGKRWVFEDEDEFLATLEQLPPNDADI